MGSYSETPHFTLSLLLSVRVTSIPIASNLQRQAYLYFLVL